jgi:hypothetical protein
MRPIESSRLLLPLLLVPLALTAQEAAGPPRAPSAGLVTLHASDDLASSFDFRSGGHGASVSGGEVLLAGQIAYDAFAPGQLSYGFVRDEKIALLDLGALEVPPQPRARDQALEFPISLFHTLFLRGPNFYYLGPGGDAHPFESANAIFEPLPAESLRHVEPELDHVYLLRVKRDKSRDEELFKFQIVGKIPDHSLTLRWARVEGG